MLYISSIQSLKESIRLFVTAASQASLSITNAQSLLKHMSTELYIVVYVYISNPYIILIYHFSPCLPFDNYKFDFEVCVSFSILYISSFVSFMLVYTWN